MTRVISFHLISFSFSFEFIFIVIFIVIFTVIFIHFHFHLISLDFNSAFHFISSFHFMPFHFHSHYHPNIKSSEHPIIHSPSGLGGMREDVEASQRGQHESLENMPRIQRKPQNAETP